MTREAARFRMSVRLEEWKLRQPFQITGHVFTTTPVVVVALSDGDCVGRGEGVGIYYTGDTAAAAAALLDRMRPAIEANADTAWVSENLPPGAARNALDCALWDLAAQRSGKPAWQRAGLAPPHRLLTTFTVGAGTPQAMVQAALGYAGARAIKLKLMGDGEDAARVRAVRDACPSAALAVDANQGFTPRGLEALWDVLLACNVMLVEQPFAVGQDSLLDGMERPIPVAADESLQTLADLDPLRGRFDVVNIKLDKSGGLTEGFAIARRARALGFGVMVGNMTGTSLSMAPAFLLGQICDVVDLDGPVFLAEDRAPGVRYSDGMIGIPQAFWGGLAA